MECQAEVDLFSFAEWLQNYDRVLEAEGSNPSVVVTKIQCEMAPAQDYAQGYVDAVLSLNFLDVKVRGAWEARGQSAISKGWYVVERPCDNAIGIFSSLSIVADGAILEPTSAELSTLAFEFWTYMSIDEIVIRMLPIRDCVDRVAFL